MSNLFRFNILRPVQEIPKERQDKIGLKTHADGTISNWATNIFDLCAENDHPVIYDAAVTFLKSASSVDTYTSTNISALLKDAVDYLRKKGRKLNAPDFNRTFSMNRLGPYFTPSSTQGPSTYTADKQAIEDTILALAFLSKLGNKGNINHLLIFKVNQLLAYANEKQAQLTQAQLNSFMAKPVVLPFCRYNKCTKKYETIEPFRHLDLKLLPTAPSQTRVPDCNCSCIETDCQTQNTCCAEIKPFVTDLMIVREELKRYEAKHLAYIENIMVGETRERIHRNLERTETFNETETETTKSVEKDHQVEDRFSLKSEIEKTLQQDLSLDAGVTTTSNLGNTILDTNFNFSYDLAKSESQQIAQEYARNVVTKSLTKVEEKVRQLTSVRHTTETEETNTHGFTNVGGVKHIVGQYHYVNMINRAQVMNYGKRLVYEFVLPEPMELYKELLKKDVLPFGMTEPVKPPFFPHEILEVESTDPLSYSTLIKEWELTGIGPLPDVDIRIPFTFENAVPVEGNNKTLTFTVDIGTIPDGYNARLLAVDIKGFDWQGDGPTIQLEWFVDGISSGLIPNVGPLAHHLFTPDFAIDATQGSMLKMVVMAKSCVGIAGSGYVTCLLSEQAKIAWKISIYEKIMAKYNQDKEEFETARARHEQEKNARLPFGNNPFINREIERTELKRLAINYISCQFFEQFSAMKRNVESCGYPEMDLDQAQRDGSFIQFFEQLFEWNLMTYLFYPYFWGQKCSWPEKVQTSSGDPLFDKALMAGAARVQVPVRAGHEVLALHWSAYGEIWQGQSEPPVPGTAYYLSMVQEIKEQKNHFYTDREGELATKVGRDWVVLTGSGLYWDFIPVPDGVLNQGAIDADIDREILINCSVYRVVGIMAGTYDEIGDPEDIGSFAPDAAHLTWTIFLDRPLDGKECDTCGELPIGTPDDNVKFQMGALFVGAPFEVVVPTNLIFLRNTKDGNGDYVSADCLPCYPLDKCE